VSSSRALPPTVTVNLQPICGATKFWISSMPFAPVILAVAPKRCGFIEVLSVAGTPAKSSSAFVVTSTPCSISQEALTTAGSVPSSERRQCTG
jgi:hypothetical protein